MRGTPDASKTAGVLQRFCAGNGKGWSAVPPRQKSKVGRLRIKAPQLHVTEETLSCSFRENHRTVADEVRDMTIEDLTSGRVQMGKYQRERQACQDQTQQCLKQRSGKRENMGQGNSLMYISCEMSINVSSLMFSLRPQLVQFLSVAAATLPVGACGESCPGFCGPGGFHIQLFETQPKSVQLGRYIPGPPLPPKWPHPPRLEEVTRHEARSLCLRPRFEPAGH